MNDKTMPPPASPPTPAPTRLMRAEMVVARGLMRLLRRLPPAASSNLGGRVARTIGPLLPVSRVADRNLRHAMPELDRRGRRRVVRGVWDNLGRTVAEFPHLARIPKNSPEGPGWEMAGEDTLLALAAGGGPAIFVSGHIGNWEMMPVALAAYGIRISSMYRRADNPLIDRMINELRDQAAGQPIPRFAKGAKGARLALAHLARGGCLGLLVDQKMNDGVEARFFGMPAMTAPAAAALALRFRVPVIPGHVERIGPARFRLVCEPPLVLPDTGNGQADQLAMTQMVNDLLERWIRERPDSWLWMHRRWPKEVVRQKGGRKPG